MPTKIEKAGKEVRKRTNELRGMGKGLKTISSTLEDEFGISVSHQGVANFLKNQGGIQQSWLAGKQAQATIDKKAQEEILDVNEELKQANGRLKQELQNLETDGTDTDKVVKILKEIRKQMEFQSKVLGKINTGTQIQNIDIDYMNMALQVNEVLDELEEDGYIKILEDPYNVEH